MIGLDTIFLTTLMAAATAVWLYRLAYNWLGINQVTFTPKRANKTPWGW